jgi:serine/threonine protein kinase
MNSERLEQIDGIFQSALDLAPERRADFLDSQCGVDSELRVEVESLLSAHERAGEFIEDSASEIAALLEKNPGRPSRIGQYKIEKLLGRGGMGAVYLAIDRIGRRVALKLLSSRMEKDQQHVARFLQEAQTVVAMNHPNIVTVYDIGETEGIYYIASELIEGENLREHLDKNKLVLNGVLEIVIQVASAIAAAHEKGIIHRDIKPENVMVRRDGYVKVLDFGIAKLTEQFAGPVSTEALTRMKFETAEGLVIGTASHMSPEQARGARVDERTDIWSCGVLLYEMLTGQQPFAGGTPAEIIARILEREPAPLSQYLTDAPPELQDIVSKSLAKDREERYQTIQDMLADLKALKQELEFAAKLKHSARQVVDAQPANESGKLSPGDQLLTTSAARKQPSGEERVERPVSSAEYIVSEIKQHKHGFLLASVVLLLAASAISYWLVSSRFSKATQIESIAVLPFINASGSSDVEYLSDGMTESLINSLSQLPRLFVKARSSVFRYKGKEVEPQQVASELSVQAILSGRVVQRGDNLTLYLSLVDGRNGNQIWGDRYDRKITELVALQNEVARDVSRKLRARLSGTDEQRLAKNYTANAEAYQLYLKGRYHVLKLTLSEIQTGISYFQQAIALDPSYALAYVGLADAYRSALVGDMPPTELLPKAKEAAEKAIEIDDTLADAHAELGFIIFWYDWDWTAAENQYKRALELDPNNGDTHLFYAHLLSNIGRHTEALAEVSRAREIDPLNLRTNTLEGQFLIHAGRTDEALGRLQKTFEMSPNYYFAHFFASSAYIEKGMFPQAIAEAQKARELSGPTNSHPMGFLGYALAKSGKQAEARALLSELLKSSSERYVSPYNIALIYNGLGQRDETFTWLEQAYKKRDQRMVFLKVEPKWNNLRDDSRFQELMRRVGFRE